MNICSNTLLEFSLIKLIVASFVGTGGFLIGYTNGHRRKVPGSIPGRVTGDFFRGIRQVHVPGVDSAFRNEYQDIPGGTDDRCVGLTNLITLMCRLSRNPGALTSRTPQDHLGLFRGYIFNGHRK
jgi:hypothetical protein